MKKIFTHSRGLAFLEFSAVALILLTFILGGFGVVEYMRSARFLTNTIDKYLYDDAVAPFEMRMEEGDSHLATDSAAIEKYVGDVRDLVAAELRAFLVKETAGSGATQERTGSIDNSFFVEVVHAELEIDPVNGAYKGIRSSFLSNVRSAGNMSRSAADNITLAKVVESAAAAAGKGMGGDNTSVYAVPAGAFMNGGSQMQFLPRAVLIGLRAGINVENGAAGALLSTFSGETAITDFKVINLRGEFKKR